MPEGIEGERPNRKLTAQINQQEQAQSQRKNSAENPEDEKKTQTAGILSRMREEIGDGRGVFRCALPKIIFSPFDIQRKYDHVIPKEQAIEEGQAWVENLKTLDKRSLEQKLEALERFRGTRFSRIREEYRTPQQAELLEYEMEKIREQLRQRGVD